VGRAAELALIDGFLARGSGRGRRVRDNWRVLRAEPDPHSSVGRPGDVPARPVATGRSQWPSGSRRAGGP